MLKDEANESIEMARRLFEPSSGDVTGACPEQLELAAAMLASSLFDVSRDPGCAKGPTLQHRIDQLSHADSEFIPDELLTSGEYRFYSDAKVIVGLIFSASQDAVKGMAE